MWDPFDKGEWWHQRSSYREQITPPTSAPGDAPLVCLQINIDWQAILAGSTTQLAQPSTWNVTGAALADVLGKVQDLIAIIGTAGLCMALQLQLTTDCQLQFSLDGGATWTTATNWSYQFPRCIKANQARLVMTDGLVDPPVPVWASVGADWLYSD